MMLLLAIILLVLTIPLASYPLSTILIHSITFLIFLDNLLLFSEIMQLGELLQQQQQQTLLTGSHLIFTIFVPLMIYTKPEKHKSMITQDLRKKAGIYQWTHLDSGKSYVGSSSDLSKRILCYYRANYFVKKGINSLVYKAIFTHHISTFYLTIFEYVDISQLSKDEARKLLMEREQLYLNEIKPKYNTLKFAGTFIPRRKKDSR